MRADRPSRTAEYMALFRALESARAQRRRLFEDRDASRFLSPGLRALVAAARIAPLRRLAVNYIDRRWPGPRLSGVVRTRVIDDFVSAALASGCEQLVLLGAGYDTRATRLQRPASSIAFELDHPTTQQRKRALVRAAAGEVRYVPIDFERDAFEQALLAAGFDRARRSCVVWEGVFSYLSPAAIDATLAALAELCERGSRIVLTYVDQRALGDGDRAAQPWMAAVRDVAEPFRTGLLPSRAAEFFAARGLRLCSDESTREAAERLGVKGAERIPGFYRLAALERS